ncbi:MULTISPECIES: Hsp20/alpha crystallin family protein [unclassified Candidatus Frackibacter]|uniref:Hsp20/alpha crystallin family protein n=1 Tax=unclassified Candidatus Frackibacter TaxID=2648818 RepID=UPI000799BDFC|nr:MULTISPECIES: Hsp20/alpha crystallin family protein [unclassified Candidatus Frackibacter]KXS43335.1 MAG: Molecular chaperone (small heat shock protein) [Candidatus Frackibacter sp. T328-2]SDC58014.1 Molecular chaperone IbpA, HSP20 family [Candidatus Frackibacter sp. WG11]SEM72100.1 Molecular chaperone IbpA, HSP20 family [Candidatus Frackibacter sp. WG12]SFL82157.1 Molecular chaperone IbpA, HSP20 family [Candidatus Frackibacter sp. WG13]
MRILQTQQSPFLARSSFSIPQQQAFTNQALQSGVMNTGYIPQQQAFAGQGLQSGMINTGYAPISQAWSYRLQPVSNAAASNAMSTGISQQQMGGQQYTQTTATPMTSTAMMQQQSTGIVDPSIDISETKNDLIVACNIPNANLNNMNLTATENSLSISAQAFVGNQVSSVHRTIPLSTTVRAEAVDANYSNGILQVRMPKKEAGTRKQLQVNVTE